MESSSENSRLVKKIPWLLLQRSFSQIK